MTITTDQGYDLATLQQARGDSPLEVRQGLATTYHWVARAEPHLDLAVTDDGRPARTMTAVLNGLGPGQRAALRALLEDAAAHVDRSPGLGAALGGEGEVEMCRRAGHPVVRRRQALPDLQRRVVLCLLQGGEVVAPVRRDRHA